MSRKYIFLDIDGTLLSIKDLHHGEGGNVDVYNLQGIKVCSNVEKENALKLLNKGVYIINGKKYIK